MLGISGIVVWVYGIFDRKGNFVYDSLNQIYRGVEQLAARQAHNLEVVGSSPTPATKKNHHKSDVFFISQETPGGGGRRKVKLLSKKP